MDYRYFALSGKVVVDAATMKLVLASGTGLSSGTTPATGTGTGTTTGTGTGGATAPAAKVAGVSIASVTGTTAAYTWTPYTAAAVTEYSAELRPRGGTAGTSDTWGGVGRWAAPPGSKGGLADGGAYELRIVAYNGAAVVAVSDPVAFTVGVVAAGTGTGTGTGAGGTGGSAGATTAVPPSAGTGAFSATYPWHIMAGGTDVAVQRVIGNAPGEVPAGHKLTAVVDGTPVTVQDLAPCYWPDGSRKAGVVSLTLPGARSGGTAVNVVFGETAGAADATVSKGRAAIAADSDFELRLSGFDLGADTFVVNLNSLLADAPGFPYGTNASRGLDVLDAGPERTRLRGWAFVRRRGDGAIHRTLKAFIYLDALKSGAYRASVRWTQDPIYGAFPGGTVGPASPTRINFVAELFNKGVRVAAWGGPNDPRAKTGDAATVLRDSRFYPPAGFSVGGDADFRGRTWALGIGVAFAGGVPSGVDPARVYWPQYADGGGMLLGTRRRSAASPAAFGAGSGALTVFPVMHSFIWSGGIGTGTDLHPVWVGPGAKPVVQPGHDRRHFFQLSRLTPPMRTDLTEQPVSGRAPRLHTPGEVYSNDIWDIGAVGDDAHISRIGWLPFAIARLLYVPNDPVLWADAFSLGVSWADFPAQHCDERAGVPPITDYGPNVDGVTYPGYAPVNGGLVNILNGDMSAAPKLNPNARPNWDASLETSHGYSEDYQLTNSFAHTPDWWYGLYLLTGDHVWLDSGIYNCAAAGMLFNHQHSAENYNYSPIITGQPRGMAWAFREWSNFLQVAPDNHHYRRVIQTYQKTNFRFYAAQTRVGLGRNIGKLYAHYNNAYEDYGGRPWHEYMLALAWGMAYWRTGDADLRTAIEKNKIFLCGWFDDTAIPGAGFWVNDYEILSNDAANRFGRGAGYVFQSPAEVIEAHAGGPPPYPASGIQGDPFVNSYVAMYAAACAVQATAGVSGPGRLRKQILRRVFGTVQEIRTSENNLGLAPSYAIVPLSNAVD